MKHKTLKIVFMGTPDFAVPTLEMMLKYEEIEVVGVVTAVDKKGGRGRMRSLESAVKRAAIAHDLMVLQPSNLKSPTFIRSLQAIKPDLIVVVAFRMLPEAVWSIPPLGTINLHASLLPAYRGAAPINWAIIRGEVSTGLTTFFIDRTIDTGQIIKQDEVTIYPRDDAGRLHDRMKDRGALLVLDTLISIMEDTYETRVQDERKVSKAPKIFKEDCEIIFQRPAHQVYNFIRGLSPYPAAWFRFHGQILRIFRTEIYPHIKDISPGEIISDGKSIALIGTADRPLRILELQLQGRKRLDIRTFLNGYQLSDDEISEDLEG